MIRHIGSNFSLICIQCGEWWFVKLQAHLSLPETFSLCPFIPRASYQFQAQSGMSVTSCIPCVIYIVLSADYKRVGINVILMTNGSATNRHNNSFLSGLSSWGLNYWGSSKRVVHRCFIKYWTVNETTSFRSASSSHPFNLHSVFPDSYRSQPYPLDIQQYYRLFTMPCQRVELVLSG